MLNSSAKDSSSKVRHLLDFAFEIKAFCLPPRSRSRLMAPEENSGQMQAVTTRLIGYLRPIITLLTEAYFLPVVNLGVPVYPPQAPIPRGKPLISFLG
jgi:hypothetical protein